ncbi:MAG: lactate utilization protein [Candidatus Eremiobacteraeota bacterium]|nr:lactate utilization protein [Candidatus Eremiobacteraeota bacterium]
MDAGFNRKEVARAFQRPAAAAVLAPTLQRSVEAAHQARAQVQWQALRDAAHDIKAYAIDNLDRLLVAFEAQFTARGGIVLWAPTAQDAIEHLLEICRRHGATAVVKGKSMVSEELAVNEHLAAAGIEAVETDLGEYIVQLAGQRPSHIVGPALHLSRKDIGTLFVDKLGIAYSEDPEVLMSAARTRLRERYLQAQVGMTGVNFAVAETGTIVVIENEGNGGLSSSLPPVHVFLMGIEKVIPRLCDLPVFLNVLARAATGQKISTYTHHFLGAEPGKTVYCIMVDANRTKLLADPKTRQSLYCIRCGACLNVCPVYRRAGGFAYGGAYAGPIGAVITPALIGMHDAGELPFVSTLCGACQDECPVKIDLPHQLVYLRHKAVTQHAGTSGVAERGIAMWARAMRDLSSYRRSIGWLRRAAAVGRAIGWYPGVLGSWAKNRTVPRPPRESFKEWWERTR